MASTASVAHNAEVDAAGKADDDPAEAVLVDIVAQSEHAGGVIRLILLLGRRHRPRRAAPAGWRPRPLRRHHGFAECRKLECDRTVGVERERRAVENQFVLTADLVDIEERQTRVGDARHRHVEANFGLVAPVRRAIGNDENFRAGLGEAFHHVLVVTPVGPGIFADRQAETYAAEAHRPRHRTRSKHALFVEHAVVRQVDLVAQRLDLAAGEERVGVVELSLLDPRRAYQHRRSAVRSLARQRFDRGAAGRLKCRLEHQILRRIAGDEQFGEAENVGAVARGLRAGATRALQIAGHIADNGVELRDGDGQTIGRTLVHSAMV